MCMSSLSRSSAYSIENVQRAGLHAKTAYHSAMHGLARKVPCIAATDTSKMLSESSGKSEIAGAG
jgi:hypothetical protein